MHAFLVIVHGCGYTEQFVVRAVDRAAAERDACRMFHVITNGVTPEAILN